MSQSIEYIALKRVTVQLVDADGETIIGDDGRPVVETREPGDAVPEANALPNVVNWVNAGFIGVRGVTPHRGPISPDRLKPGKSRKQAKGGTRKRVAQANTEESRAPEAPQSPTEPSPEVPAETVEATAAEATEAESE